MLIVMISHPFFAPFLRISFVRVQTTLSRFFTISSWNACACATLPLPYLASSLLLSSIIFYSATSTTRSPSSRLLTFTPNGLGMPSFKGSPTSPSKWGSGCLGSSLCDLYFGISFKCCHDQKNFCCVILWPCVSKTSILPHP